MASIRKEHDWIGENLTNPTFTNTDFKEVGININNTSIGPESAYVSNSQIRALPEFQTNGKFDEAKFHEKYVELASSYNDLARNTYYEDLKNQGQIFAENNIFVSPEERKQTADAYLTIMNNPDHISYGIVGLNQPGPRTKTPMELAEQNKIYDSETGKFTEYTAEESFFKDFWRPKIMATWDFNADANGNPTDDPDKIAYMKGQYKLDPNGEYYMEFSNGKSTYGKEIVSPWNLITKEDSWINKYDPFDSDGINKSTTGSIVRNALKVLPLLTPVAPYYAAASLGINIVDALGTLGKLVVGSDNPTLNTITAFAEQFNQSTSEEGIAHPFSMENIINMVGDTFMFLESQRIFAEQAPKLFSKEAARIAQNPNEEIRVLTGNYIDDGMKAIDKKYRELKKITSDLALLDSNKAREVATLYETAGIRAAAIVNNQVQNYHKLGRQLSTGLMAVTFGLHTYGTAKAQNVTDEAATALTLGAIAGQFALLNSHIAQKIFPEATIERQQINKAIKEWVGLDKEYAKQVEATAKAITSEEKQKALHPIFSKGYNMAKAIWDVQESIPATIAASTAATGIEMVSFSVLDDLIASTYNLASWISGNDNRMNAWDNVLERYGTSLIGGGIAGGMTARKTYQNAMRIRNMERPEAFATIIHMINEGKDGELLKIIDKGKWGNEYLSTEIIAKKQLNPGEYEELYGSGTPEKNENEEIKTILKNTILDLKTTLETYGTIISENSLLDVMINGKNITKDLRLAALKSSNFAKAYIKAYTDNQYQIYNLAQKISLDPKAKKARNETDAMSREIREEKKQIEKAQNPYEEQEAKDKSSPETNKKVSIEEQLANKIKENREFFSGKKRLEFIKKALFEMQYGLNAPFIDRYFIEWATNKEHVDSITKIAQSRLKDLAREFYEEAGSELELDKLNHAFNLYEQTLYALTPAFKKLKEMTQSEQLKEFTDMFEKVRVAEKNQLFSVLDTEKGVVNPYDIEEQSPYGFSRNGRKNTPIRPEQVMANIAFPIIAKNKFGFDAYNVLVQLLNRYKTNAKGIKKLFALYDNLTTYKNLISEIYQKRKELVNQYNKDLEIWKQEFKEFQENPENEGKAFRDAPKRPDDITEDSILAALEQYKEKIDADSSSSNIALSTKKSQKEVVDLFTKLREFIKANKPQEGQEATKEFNSAYKLYRTLIEYGEMLRPDLTEEDAKREKNLRVSNFNNLRNSIMNIIQFSILDNQGTEFITELQRLLENSNGYLNDFHRESILTLLENFQSFTNPEGGTASLTFDTLNIAGEKLFTTLNNIQFLKNGEDTTSEILTLQDRISNLDYFDNKLIDSSKLLTNTINKVNSYNTDSIIEVADNLMEKLTGKEKEVSSVLAMLNQEIRAKTQDFIGFGRDQFVNTSEFILSDDFINRLDQAILVLQMVRSGLAGSTEEVESAFNHVGYAATVEKIKKEHGIKDGPTLTTLGLDLVNTGIQNIQNTIYKLLYWKKVAENASVLRSNLVAKTDLGFRLNLMDQTYKKITQISQLQEWKGLDEFRATVNSLNTFNELRTQAPNDRLKESSEEQQETIKKELITFEKAVHKLFAEDNADIIKDPVKLSQFINEDNFALGFSVSAITNEDKLTDDNGIIWYIATLSAIDPDVFYSNLKESLLENRLPVALQIQYKMNAAAMHNSKETFNNFRLALIESYKRRKDPKTKQLLYPDLNSDNLEARTKAEQKFASEVLSSTATATISNIMLLSSGPGFGKSTYIPELVLLLEKIFKDFNKETDLWISGPDNPNSSDRVEMAKKMRDDIGAKETPTFNRDTLMSYILKDFNDYENTFKVVNGKLRTDAKLELNLDGSIKFPFELNDNIQNVPKIIIVDEISEFSTFDIAVLDAFAKKHDITVLAHGDFTQSGIYGQVKVNEFGEEAIHELGLKDTQFIRGFKSQLSFRSTNKQTDVNNAALRIFMEELLNYYRDPENNNKPNPLNIYHYRDKETGNLYGIYMQHKDAYADGTTAGLTKTTEEYIDGLYKSLEDGEKVVLVYGDENSAAYNYIKNKGLLEKTQQVKGSVIKSTENKYYIIDLNTGKFDNVNLTDEQRQEAIHYVREYYTALTRQKQGTILIDHINENIPAMSIQAQEPETNTTRIELPAKTIQKLSTQFAKLLNEIYPEAIPNKNTTNKRPTSKSNTPEGSKDKDKKVDPAKIELDGDIPKSDDFARFANYGSARLQESQSLRLGRNNGSIQARGVTANNNPYQIPDEFVEFILNTFNVLRTGLTTDFKYSKYAEQRRDCVNGLRYIQNTLLKNNNLDIPDLDNPSIDTDQKVREYIIRIHHLIKSTRDNNELRQELYKLLKLNEVLELKDFDIRYAVISYPEKWTTEDGRRLDRNPWLYVDRENEKCWGGKGTGEKNNTIMRKELVLIMGKNGGNASDEVYLTVPVLSLPNYKTVYNRGKSSLSEVVTRTLDHIFETTTAGHTQNIEVAKALRDILSVQPDATGAAALLKILEYYCFTGNDIVFLNSDVQLTKTEKNPNGLFNFLGWFVSASDRGFDYDAEGREQTSRENGRLILHKVSDLLLDGDKDITRIYTAYSTSKPKNFTDSRRPGFTIQNGAYYVFVADKKAFKDAHGNFVEEDMFKYYQEQLDNPNLPILVTALAVRPPEATFEEFINSERDSLFAPRGSDKHRQDIGNQFTIYRVLQKVVAANAGDKKVESIANRIIALNNGNNQEYAKVEKEILKMTYAEGTISPERKQILGEIFNIAQNTLRDTEKTAIEQQVKSYSGYVPMIDSMLSNLVKQGDRNIQLRTKLRRFLQILFDPKSMSSSEFINWRNYDLEEFQKFLTDVISEQALVYNPEFININSSTNADINAANYNIVFKTEDGATNTITFCSTKTDSLTDINKMYQYKGKDFMYASTLFSGPFVGNIMQIIDKVITSKSNSGGFRPDAERINVFNKMNHRKTILFFNNVLEDVYTSLRIQSDKIDDIRDALTPHNLQIKYIGDYKYLVFSNENLPEKDSKVMDVKPYKTFKDKDKLNDLAQFNEDTIIFKLKSTDGLTKYYALDKVENQYKFTNVTKATTPDPWTKSYPFTIKSDYLGMTFHYAPEEGGLVIFDQPVNMLGGFTKILIIGEDRWIERPSGERIKLETEEDKNIIGDIIHKGTESVKEAIDDKYHYYVNSKDNVVIVPINKKTIIDHRERIVNSISLVNNKLTINIDGEEYSGALALSIVKTYFPDTKLDLENVIINEGNIDSPFRVSEDLHKALNNMGGTYEGEEITIRELLTYVAEFTNSSLDEAKGLLLENVDLGKELKESLEKTDVGCF